MSVEDRNSMLYWWGLVKDLPVPKPRTRILRLDERTVRMFFEFPHLPREEKRKFTRKVEEIIEQLRGFAEELGGYPVFLRSDYTSGKFCYYDDPLYMIRSEEDFKKIWSLICECHEPLDVHFLLPPRPNALIVREWLNIEKWTNIIDRYNTLEVRLFIKDGKVVEVYPYYHWTGIEERLSKRLGEKIKELRKDYERYVNAIKRDLDILLKYARVVAERVEGYWSVDFAKAGEWYFIDMATGELSWMPQRMDEFDRRLNALLRLRLGVRG